MGWIRRYGIWAYLGLLALSYVVSWYRPTPSVPKEMEVMAVPEYRADGTNTGRAVQLAYHDRRPAGRAEAPVVVLLHGSPGASSFILPMVDALDRAETFRFIVPDLPGLGFSENGVADYSIAAHSHYVFALLDALKIEQAHVVGYSMGGGVALEMAGERPERVESIVMNSAIGVQEYELFGQYEINHSVHWMQWFLLSAVEWGIPHFGTFSRQPINTYYALNFLQSDQRPLRGLLETYSGPMLIQHGRTDGLVPLQAALEHARLVPQSRLELYEGGHGLFAFRPEVMAADLLDFLRAAEAGLAPDRSTADSARLSEAAKPFERDRTWHYSGLAAFLVALLLIGATMISEDLTCIGGGFLVANGLISMPLAISACFFGIFTGDLLLYAAGRKLGRPALARRPMRWVVSEEAVQRAERWFHRRGAVIILLSRFLPGTRAATYFSAGVVRAPFWKFLFFFGTAAAIWTPLLVIFASLIGEQMVVWYASYETWALPILVVGALVVYGMVQFGIPLLSWRGRRLLLGKWRRLVRWEYWPLWVVNAPVVAYVLWLVFIRYRRPTAFTLCNPGIPHGGFLGESKAAILKSFRQNADYMLPWTLLRAGEPLHKRQERFRAFQENLEEPWPVVIKPNEGQRGLAVHVVRKRSEAEALLSQTAVAWIVQAYAAGEEYGVFYYREPGEATGQIPSITTKVMTAVEGDGRSTLEELILRDDRAVDRAVHFLRAHSERLETIPDAGVRIPLVELGTHAKGATFLDGRELLTPSLSARVDAIAKDFDGFNYGRFDFRVPDAAALRAGRGIKLIEVNGLTSEQTHIYAPGRSIWSAWRTLMASWHLAIRIGLAHEAASGLKPWPLGKFLSSCWSSHCRQRKLGA